MSLNKSIDKINFMKSKTIRILLLFVILFTVSCSEKNSTFLRVAILGDAEPKPLAEFPGTAAAVEQVNRLAQEKNIDFVMGVGDIPHKGKVIQYEESTKILQKLTLPFYPIMGNEERESTVERYLDYAQKWNSEIESPRYVLDYDKLAFVFASPDHGRDFNDSGATWILEQIQNLAPKPVFLVVHSAQAGVYPENSEKGVHNSLFIEKVVPQPNLAAVISGDLHMDMDRVDHSKKIDHVHYIHIPALERTKIPDKTKHTPMFRVMTIAQNGKVTVKTYSVENPDPIEEHKYSFSLSLQE
ncbi:MAG TPA: metallophosphoesterase [bacterium]|nr:metallophosphoesterase [bacterium]